MASAIKVYLHLVLIDTQFLENYVSDALWRGRICNSVTNLSRRSQSIDRVWAGVREDWEPL